MDGFIAEATAPASSAQRDAALHALAAELDAPEPRASSRGPDVFTGEVHDAPETVTAKAIERLSMEVSALSVALFGAIALWRGDEWVVNEDEAGLIGETTANAYAEEAAELTERVKWLGPVIAVLAVAGKKAAAEAQRKRAEREAGPRAPGTAPAGA